MDIGSMLGGGVGGLISGIGGLFKKKAPPAARWGNTLQDLGMGDLAYYMNLFGDPVMGQYFGNNEKAKGGWENTFGTSFGEMAGGGGGGGQAPNPAAMTGYNTGGASTGNAMGQHLGRDNQLYNNSYVPTPSPFPYGNSPQAPGGNKAGMFNPMGGPGGGGLLGAMQSTGVSGGGGGGGDGSIMGLLANALSKNKKV